MTAIHGKDALIYLSPGTGAAIAISEQNAYSIDSDFDLSDSSELGDTWKTNVKGLLGWSAKISGNFDTASSTLWSAHTASTVSNFYIYPQRSVLTQYYYGTAWVKLDNILSGGTTDKAKGAFSLTGEGALTPKP